MINEKKKLQLVKILLLYNFSFPTFNFVFSASSVAVGSIFVNLIPMLITFIVVLKNRRFEHLEAVKKIFFFFFFFLIWINLSLMLTPNKILFRDLFELHRPVLFCSAYLFAFIIKWDLDKIKKYVIKPMVLVFILLILLGILIVFPINRSFKFMIFGLYTKESNIRMLRATGTFPNPYDYGFMMIIPFFFYLLSFLKLKGKLKNLKKKIIFIILEFLCLYSILVTQSRTAFISFFFSVFYFLVFSFVTSRIVKLKLRNIFFLLVLVLIVIFSITSVAEYININFPYLYSGIKTVLTQGVENQSSYAKRLVQKDFVLEQLKKRPLLGFGPSKDVKEFIEMQYTLYLYRYGLIGFICIIIIIVFSVYISYRAYRKIQNCDSNVESFFLAVHIWCVAIPLASFGNAFIEQIRISYFFYFILGVLTKIVLTPKNNLKENEKRGIGIS